MKEMYQFWEKQESNRPVLITSMFDNFLLSLVSTKTMQVGLLDLM